MIRYEGGKSNREQDSHKNVAVSKIKSTHLLPGVEVKRVAASAAAAAAAAASAASAPASELPDAARGFVPSAPPKPKPTAEPCAGVLAPARSALPSPFPAALKTAADVAPIISSSLPKSIEATRFAAFAVIGIVKRCEGGRVEL